MKISYTKLALAFCCLFTVAARAQLNIPGADGSDGPFNPTTNTNIDLSAAMPGLWDADNTPNKGKGVYDSSKWAVVFKYSSVNIPFGVTVTFKNHTNRAPVVWLVSGNVIVVGTIDIGGGDGGFGNGSLIPAEPGPGGFRGGAAGPQGGGLGLGPGAGKVNSPYGAGYGGVYGNSQVLPLIGGSGGGANFSAGGGALLIAAAGTVTINGVITSRGGSGQVSQGTTGVGGSGGAVRIIANQVTGAGEINCLGHPVYSGNGRIRIETTSLAPTVRTFPETIGVPPANPPVIWSPTNAPKVRITSVDGVASPSEPTAPLLSAPDIAIQKGTAVSILVETRDFPIEGDVEVYARGKFGGQYGGFATRISGTQLLATWRLITTLPEGFTTLQVRAVGP